MPWRTQNSRRPDLEEQPVNLPEGYIGHLIYPVEHRRNSSGEIFYAPLHTEGAAQTGRDPKTGEIVRNFIASASSDYKTEEVIYRASLPKVEVDDLGGLAYADSAGGVMAKRGVMGKLEGMHAAALFTGADHPVTAGGFFDAMSAGGAAVKRYAGPLALVSSLSTYRYIIQQEEVIKRLSFAGVSLKNRESVLSLNPETLLDMLQNIFAVQKILIGDDNYWDTAALRGRAALVKLPSQEPMSYKLAPELGKTMVYMLDDSGKVYEIESSCDEKAKINDYDGTSYLDIVEFNAGAKYLMSGFAKPVEAPEGGEG